MALEIARKLVDCPVIGVVPAIKTAAKLTTINVIGLLATPATTKRTYIRQLIVNYAQQCHVIKVGCTQLVLEAEKKVRGEAVNFGLIKKTLGKFFINPDITPDYIILGCTHFPLLKDYLNAAVQQHTRKMYFAY